MTTTRVEKLAEATVEAIRDFVSRSLGKRDTRLDDFERRLRAVETNLQSVQRGFPYAGVWREGKTYHANDFVTDHGSLWYCHATTTERPGTTDDWQLAVKSGERRR